jgi:hypothetical protein
MIVNWADMQASGRGKSSGQAEVQPNRWPPLIVQTNGEGAPRWNREIMRKISGDLEELRRGSASIAGG